MYLIRMIITIKDICGHNIIMLRDFKITKPDGSELSDKEKELINEIVRDLDYDRCNVYD